MSRARYTPQQQEFYRRYLKSPAWRVRTARRILIADNRCEFVAMRTGVNGQVPMRCTNTRLLQCHHNTYERLGHELDSDLDVLCWLHHQVEHLLWKRCTMCQEPCAGNETLAELWLSATLAQMGIDLASTRVRWKDLPTKEQLAAQLNAKCMSCRGVVFREE